MEAFVAGYSSPPVELGVDLVVVGVPAAGLLLLVFRELSGAIRDGAAAPAQQHEHRADAGGAETERQNHAHVFERVAGRDRQDALAVAPDEVGLNCLLGLASLEAGPDFATELVRDRGAVDVEGLVPAAGRADSTLAGRRAFWQTSSASTNAPSTASLKSAFDASP